MAVLFSGIGQIDVPDRDAQTEQGSPLDRAGPGLLLGKGTGISPNAHVYELKLELRRGGGEQDAAQAGQQEGRQVA